MKRVLGRVILLSGASSSGKTSIGRALLHRLADPWFFVPVDAFGAMRSTVHTRPLNDDELAEVLRRTGLAITGLLQHWHRSAIT